MNYSVIRFILTVALCFSCNLSQAITKNIKEYHVNGNVYCIGVKEYSFFKEFGEIKRGNQISEHYTYFLQNGNVFIDSLVPNKKYKRYVYDENNRLKEEMLITVGAGRKLQIGDGNYHYNDTSNYILYKYLKYDNNTLGFKNGVVKYKRNKTSLEKVQEIDYWRNNNEDGVSYFNKSGDIDIEEITKGNTLTKKIWSSFNDRKSPISISIETLNNSGFPIKKSVEAVGGLASGTYMYKYDEHNNIISEIRKEGNAFGQGEETLITRKYEYDNNGNWVRQLEFKNGVLKTWIERVIYYANSASDYTKVVEQDKQVSDKQFKIYQKEMMVIDSLDNVAKVKAAYEDSIRAANNKLDSIIEKELLEKHITVTYETNAGSYHMKLYGFENKIRDCNIDGNTIEFIEKKGVPNYIMKIHSRKLNRYEWNWDTMHDTKQLMEVWHSQDYSDILLYIDGAKKKGFLYTTEMVVLHKNSDSDNYVAYLIDKDAYKKLEMNRPQITSSKLMDASTRYLEWRGKKSY